MQRSTPSRRSSVRFGVALTEFLLAAALVACSESSELPVGADADAGAGSTDTHRAGGDSTIGTKPEPTLCNDRIGAVALALDGPVATSHIAGLRATEDGVVAAFDSDTSPPRHLARLRCDGSTRWASPFPADRAAGSLEPARIPISKLPSGDWFACGQASCGRWTSEGTPVWSSADAASQPAARAATGAPAPFSMFSESAWVWGGRLVRSTAVQVVGNANSAGAPLVWALDAATGKPAGVWTAPIPSAQWFEAAAALAPSGPCCEFAPTAGVASSDGKSFLVFGSMRGVRDPDHFDATVPYAVRTVLGQDGSWGKVEPMPIAEPSPVPNLFASGALWDVQRGHGSEILFGLSTHDRVGASGSSVYENQVVRLDAKGEVLTVEPLPGRVAGRLIPGMQDGDTPRAGMLFQLESGRWAVVRSREPGDLRQVSRGVPELLLLDRHGNLLVRRTVPLAWTKPHWNRAPRRESPDDVRLDRSMVEPAVAEEPNGRLLVAAEQQLWRTTPWLQFDDNEAGVCADKTLDDCDDGNPCTADLCAPTNGCVHPPHLDGAPCGVGKACSEGSCVAGK